ncbi:MAG: DNA alkylation repair protein [Clostridiales bacterium]|nr:DNA alkylation repair protein [Clostridiales bacterium]
MSEKITRELFARQDLGYRNFSAGLTPNLDPAVIIGVRQPALRLLAKSIAGTAEAAAFLQELPHSYYEENNLHGCLISGMRDYDACIAATEAFLPYVDNWATCDLMSPKVFRKHLSELLSHIRSWLRSGHTYTVRFAIGMLMKFYLDEAFDEEYPALVASVRSEEYYVNMMIAWYFATALAKQWERVIPYLEERRLDRWTHRKTIRKAIESRRITREQKEYLRSLG